MKSGTGSHELMKKIKANLKSYLLSKIAYFSDNKMESLSGSGLEQVVAIIVKKAHFFETDKVYPISNKSHVIKALQLDANSLCPFEDADFFYDLKKVEQGYEAHFWFYKKSLIEKLNNGLLKKALFIFPENYLIFKALPLGQMAFIDDGNYWVSNNSAQQSFKISKNNTTLLNDKDNTVSVDSFQEKTSLFKLGLYKALPSLLSFKLSSEKSGQVNCRYCNFIQSAFVATFLYLLASTALIKGLDLLYQNKSHTNTELVAGFIETRTAYRSEQDIYAALTVGIDGNVGIGSIFEVLAQTTKSYTLERISTRDNSVFITAVSEEPLAVLEDMINLDMIKNVRFANKVSDININNLQRFTITYQY